MSKNLKAWQTTVPGIFFLLMMATYVLLPMLLTAKSPEFQYEVNSWFVGGMTGIGLLLILAPSSLVEGLKALVEILKKFVDKRAGVKVVALLLLGWSLAGCCSYKKAQRKFGQVARDSVYVTVKDTLKVPVDRVVTVPGDSLLTRLQIDSLLAAKVGDTLKLVTAGARGEVKLWKDRYNNYLNMDFSIRADTIYLHDTVRVPYQVRIGCPPVVDFEEQTNWMKVLNVVGIFCVLVLLTAVVSWIRGR
jgi:hypothetical protein